MDVKIYVFVCVSIYMYTNIHYFDFDYILWLYRRISLRKGNKYLRSNEGSQILNVLREKKLCSNL